MHHSFCSLGVTDAHVSVSAQVLVGPFDVGDGHRISPGEVDAVEFTDALEACVGLAFRNGEGALFALGIYRYFVAVHTHMKKSMTSAKCCVWKASLG